MIVILERSDRIFLDPISRLSASFQDDYWEGLNSYIWGIINGEQSRTMKKFVVWFLVIISLAVLVLRFSGTWAEVFFGIKPTSGISISSVPSDAIVYLNNKEAGKTPYENKNLDAGDINVRLDKEGALWQGKVNLTVGTITMVNRDLAFDLASSAGEILTLDRGKGLTVVSIPADALVEVDGKLYGKTPVSIDIPIGEHTILISRPNYLNRSIRATIPANFNLTVSVSLALSEADLTAIATPVITQTPEVLVKNTPTGYLRVRDKPSLNGVEIAQVKPGNTLILLEELVGWDRVRLSDSKEGYVSSLYVEKKNP